MIVSFRHKGLKRFYLTGSTRGIQVEHAPKLTRILAALHAASNPLDLALPGYRLHQLRGSLEGHWSISVSGNWRITFRFIGTDIELVDYLDYH